MKLSKILGVVAVAVLALMAFVSAASATTLETNGVKKSEPIALTISLSGSATISDTADDFANTCSETTVHVVDSTWSGTQVSGPETFSVGGCTHSPVVVNAGGSLSVERIGTTTNGTVRSSGANVTTPVTLFGFIVSVTCTTSNTDLGTLNGTASGTSSITINAVIACSSALPSARWRGTYAITGHAIGVVA